MVLSGGGPTSPFSDEERALLSRYVTSTAAPVFALTHLPEVIKGALFSRYSRSTLGLRELLLTEFINDPEAEFAAIEGADSTAPADAEQAAQRSHLAVERAQAFYSRILDGYGDDSIGELGGAHLAIEQVSMIATKVLEDARIGGSPLEKSTRYVYFADQVDGDFLFCKEPTLMASPHRERYLATCRALFETNRDLIEPMTAYVEKAAPREEGLSEAAWKRSVRARVFDALRGLLPASTLTNMGIYGNGRFFETLLIRLQGDRLAELEALGRAMYGELKKVIPSFIRRADPEHPHFAGFADYATRLHDWSAALAGSFPLSGRDSADEASPAIPRREVELHDWDPEAEEKVLTALVYPASECDWPEARGVVAGLSPQERAGRLAELAALRQNRRHKPPRALEMAAYTFDLLGDFGMYRDMHRHRMLTQQRQPLSTRHGFVMPEEVAEAGQGETYAAAMAMADETFQAIAGDFPAEAQYVVPMAYRIRWHMQVNLRALIWLVELRSSPQGHPAYRRMAQDLFHRIKEVHPSFAPLFKFVDLEDYPLGRAAAEERREQKSPAP